jgi:uncharacterized protein with beta-barrel porin domain
MPASGSRSVKRQGGSQVLTTFEPTHAMRGFIPRSLTSFRTTVVALLTVSSILLIMASAVEAGCAPPAGPGTPVSGTTVTCSGTTTNQNPQVGYGDGSQNGLTINVLGGASVIGTGAGFALDGQTTANTINNSGTIRDDGSNPASFNGISSVGTGTVNLTNSGSGIISGTSANANAAVIGVNVGTTQGSNAGHITVTGNGSETAGINAIGVSFANTGTIAAAGSTVNGTFGVLGLTSLIVTNSGTISANGGIGLTGTAIESISGTLIVTNNAGGLISGTETNTSGFSLGVFAGGTGFAVIVNAGTIHGDDIAIGSLSSVSNTIINTGTISGGAFDAIRFVGTAASSVENAGVITATGGAAIRFAGSNNVLTLDPGSSINRNVLGTGADTFQLGGNGAASFDVSAIGPAAQYQGFGTFNKIGTSIWTLTGTNAAALPWTVSAGTLSVDGSIATSSVTVNTGGTLGGSGTVGNTSILGGTLAPGSATGSTFGPLTVHGSLAFTAASTYMIQVSPANAGRTNVTGTATLAGATVNANFAAGAYFAKQYTIVNAGGGVSGKFGALVSTNLPASVSSSLSYDANDVFLNLAVSFAAPGGLNGNQQSVANALTTFFNTNGSLSVAFASLTPGGLTQASGEVATGSQQTTFDAMSQFMGVLIDPFIAGRGDGGTLAAGAKPFAEERDTAGADAAAGKPRTGNERDAYAAITRKAPVPADPFTQRWSVWAAGYGGSQTTDGSAALGSNTATSRVFGTAVGADYRFSPSTLAGFALAGGGTNFSVSSGLGSGRSDLFQAGVYLRHTAGAAYVSAALAYGWQDIATDRTVTIAGVDRLRAEFNANAFSGRLEGGYRFVTPWMAGITPYAAAQFTTFDLPAYAETVVSGANNFALGYGAKDVTASRSELGVRSDKSFAMQDAILTLRGRLAWAHDFNADRTIAATFQTLPGASFVVGGAAQAHDSALTTASAEMKWLNGVSLGATFEGEFSDVTRSYAGKGVVRYAW